MSPREDVSLCRSNALQQQQSSASLSYIFTPEDTKASSTTTATATADAAEGPSGLAHESPPSSNHRQLRAAFWDDRVERISSSIYRESDPPGFMVLQNSGYSSWLAITL